MIYAYALGAVGGAGIIALASYFIYKKCLSKAAKRTPYTYNQFELMSFEL